MDPLRQEITTALKTHGGWNKSAIESMTKLDSFIKEAQRFNPLDAGKLPFTMTYVSNDTVISG